ncbi:N-acetylmuramoyl-L-alanine amidase [Actinoplanes hulinensis]|uniref:N-acetylmuramoyl-L-alanine amidase n=2 Tax=Actinoplanes TaxID=1865 RepID=A0A7W5AQA9_9ACTN|nr:MULTISPECIES: N-acetylmuramoyl-L-alanine amidase [Actinoplanes]MBB3100501.1 N-acetylmuramoyl-L-alanine amidase [Actinoplanes campanulatus]MBW6438043.1 N-acetylmuramoyl-L-alanine amidase [Actinoplanes hulinensis]GGN25208.1 N-acetylmuramoyl-L-alanine amidase [Actinoplanes campanulatus]GID39461.1 N-acetylmuramoyl-L-alanine amidase [Actinoplanes campanulatus]GID46221.1 N-acetylmuramoyl-L-alanine amidase [Actinoplanes capillaceus]
MRSIRRGDTGPAVSEIRSILVGLELLDEAEPDVFDEALETAVRAFQQNRGLGVDGMVGDETWGALDAARWRLGSRTLFHSVPDALVGEDVRALQERLLEMGYDTGRPDAVYGARTARAVAQFQREVGLVQDGSCGPQTMKALRRLGRKVVGGRPQWLREAEAFRQSGPNLVGKTIVIDPGHGGGDDTGVLVPDGPLRWNEADLVFDLASRLEGRLSAAGMRVHLTRGPSPAAPMSGAERAALANSLGADLLISLHLDGHTSDAAEGVATYHYGTGNGLSSTVGERLAALVQREIVVRTGMHDCRTHAKTWDLLRLTRMPTVRVDLGYLTSPKDRERLIDPMFREQIVEALLAAVQRMYFPVERDVPTGSIDVRQLRLALADKA